MLCYVYTMLCLYYAMSILSMSNKGCTDCIKMASVPSLGALLVYSYQHLALSALIDAKLTAGCGHKATLSKTEWSMAETYQQQDYN